jgi:DNA-3-methyladenine glycosylase II
MNQLQQAADYLRTHDKTLAPVIARSPLPSFKKHTDYYETLVDSIISQQLSVKAAASIEKRFKDLFDGSFPSPQQILQKDIEELRSVGLSRPKARYVQDLAQHILDGTVRFDAIDTMTNEEIIAQLTTVKGIGEWTVHMFLMFCMARLDVLPIGDLGIRNGVQKLYKLDHVPTPQEVADIAAKNSWHPYQSVASWYVWQSLDNAPEIAVS